MALLAPLFLSGLLVIALPIYLHRLQTQSTERKRFSSTMLLESSRQQVHLKKKLRYLLLLVLRVALLGLLALSFAKPVLERNSVIELKAGSVLHLLVIDTSFSMQYGNLADHSRTEARKIIAELPEADLAQVLTASNTLEVLGEADKDHNGLTGRINSIHFGNGHLDYGVMMTSINSLIKDARQNIHIHLISDFQTTGLPARFADLVPTARGQYHTELTLHPQTEQQQDNLYVDTIIPVENGLDVGVRSNLATATEIRVALKNNGVIVQEQSRTIESGGQSRFMFTVSKYEDGDNRIEAVIGNTDGLIADNTRYAVVDNTPPKPVLLLTSDTQGLPVKYLQTAVEAGKSGYRAEPVLITEFDPRVLQRYSWIMIDDIGIIDSGLATSLLEYLQGGGAILAASGERALAQSQLPLLNYPIRQAILSANDAKPGAVTGIDASHPVLAGTSGWRDINVSRYLDLVTDPQSHNMVSLDNGAALILERKFGQGRLLLLTSSLDNRWNDLPVHPVFVNFIAEAAKYLSGRDQLKRSQVAGDYLQLIRSGTAAGQVIAPDGKTILSLADTHRSQQIPMDLPGFYQIYTSDSEHLIAVNPDLRESDLTVMPVSDLDRWQQALQGPAVIPSTQVDNKIEDDPVQLWPILLILLGIVVMVESLLGNTYLGSGRGSV